MRVLLLVVGAAALATLLACSTKQTPPPESAEAPRVETCTPEQFVACETGEACARRRGVLIQAKPCFDKAADACAALKCEHGCNIHHGTPKDILCAPNASSSSHMKTCAGFANWACPEKMRCEVTEKNADDAPGLCVPDNG